MGCHYPHPATYTVATDYTALSDFMGGWFHQDFDIEGTSLAEVVTAFRCVTPVRERTALESEIVWFLADHPKDLDSAFRETFRLDVNPSAFAESTHAFLEEVQEQLGGGR